MSIEKNDLGQEWCCLQNQQDSYEKYSLVIKLTNVLVVSLCLFHTQFDLLIPLLSAVLWVQDGIWKTYQSRIGERLLVVEKAISDQQTSQAMQFNRQWVDNRPSSAGLIKEYILNALRPTVVFPHIGLVLASLYIAMQ